MSGENPAGSSRGLSGDGMPRLVPAVMLADKSLMPAADLVSPGRGAVKGVRASGGEKQPAASSQSVPREGRGLGIAQGARTLAAGKTTDPPLLLSLLLAAATLGLIALTALALRRRGADAPSSPRGPRRRRAPIRRPRRPCSGSARRRSPLPGHPST